MAKLANLMGFFAICLFVVLLLATQGPMMAAAQCLPTGTACTENSNPPCCSGFCLRQPNQALGSCT